MSVVLTDVRPPFARRLWIYQAERFPVLKHGLVIAVFALSGVALPHLVVGGARLDDATAAVVAVAVCFLAFLQLRIADEHKDHEDDRRFRPERPVPRGLINLGELRWIGVAAAAAQAVLAWRLDPALLVFLAGMWLWMALMTAEFFAPRALKARPILYLASHMVITPLIALFAVACGWAAAGMAFRIEPPVIAFLALAYANGAAIEIARSNAFYSAWALSHDAPELAVAAATSRVAACKAYQLAGEEMIQMHGGVGFTWEYDCHLFYRRARYTGSQLGTAGEWSEKLVSRLEKQYAA